MPQSLPILIVRSPLVPPGGALDAEIRKSQHKKISSGWFTFNVQESIKLRITVHDGNMKKVWLSWSTGKDSAWALHELRKEGKFEVAGIFTTITEHFARVSVHGVRESLLEAQADRLGIPLHKVKIPWPCSNKIYESTMERIWTDALDSGVQYIAFGDLFLEDIRQYRIERLCGTGLCPVFPLWKKPTGELAETMIASGVRATVTCIDPKHLSADFSGREFDAAFLESLPSTVDPCGENGEFHTFVHAGPMFSRPIRVRTGEVVTRSGFIYADVISCEKEHEAIPRLSEPLPDCVTSAEARAIAASCP